MRVSCISSCHAASYASNHTSHACRTPRYTVVDVTAAYFAGCEDQRTSKYFAVQLDWFSKLGGANDGSINFSWRWLVTQYQPGRHSKATINQGCWLIFAGVNQVAFDANGKVRTQIAKSIMIGAIPACTTLHWCNGSTCVLAKAAAAARRRQALQGLKLPWSAGVAAYTQGQRWQLFIIA